MTATEIDEQANAARASALAAKVPAREIVDWFPQLRYVGNRATKQAWLARWLRWLATVQQP